jgi:hypothetical protein
MFDFGTSARQVLSQSCTQFETSDGQALVSINKHIQTIENNKNINKPIFLKKLNSNNSKTIEKQKSTVPYQDNLKTSTNKNYDEPL